MDLLASAVDDKHMLTKPLTAGDVPKVKIEKVSRRRIRSPTRLDNPLLRHPDVAPAIATATAR